VGNLVANLVLAIRGASALTLLVAVLVLGGALAAGHRHRVYDAVILKTLGATRVRLLGAYALEYLMIGFATAVFGVIAGSIAAWMVVTAVLSTVHSHQLPGQASSVLALDRQDEALPASLLIYEFGRRDGRNGVIVPTHWNLILYDRAPPAGETKAH